MFTYRLLFACILLALVASSPAGFRRATDWDCNTKYGIPGASYVCSGPYFRGSTKYPGCNYITSPGCRNNVNGTTIHSIGPDPRTECTIWDQLNCQGKKLLVNKKLKWGCPGWNNFPDQFMSFSCEAI
ncbi:hypothetical protein CC86DRAFT_455865 [Ophiobolus disseminans]|uniref:Secreted protein n=1 Tax=Ophiobolus disseminans TaxID=1469910 RepID=A0A6A6ZZP8_9PLEO|nr:hypothetical protein CC86DRAFT_455865 [Ophiobolus disseminans]